MEKFRSLFKSVIKLRTSKNTVIWYSIGDFLRFVKEEKIWRDLVYAHPTAVVMHMICVL
jgi:hypothetical protein